MDDAVDALDSGAHRIGIANIADDQFDVFGEFSGIITVAMNLFDQTVEYPYPIPALDQRIHYAEANKSVSTGDEDMFRHCICPTRSDDLCSGVLDRKSPRLNSSH